MLNLLHPITATSKQIKDFRLFSRKGSKNPEKERKNANFYYIHQVKNENIMYNDNDGDYYNMGRRYFTISLSLFYSHPPLALAQFSHQHVKGSLLDLCINVNSWFGILK